MSSLGLKKMEAGAFPLRQLKISMGFSTKPWNRPGKIIIIPFNPSDACKLPWICKEEIKPLNETQAAAFLEKIQGHTHEYLFQIALFTGMRKGELLGLSWNSVDLDHGKLVVRQQLCREKKKGGKYYISSPKNSKKRILALAPSVV